MRRFSVLLVALGATSWATDGVLRTSLVQRFSPQGVVLVEHLILTLLTAPLIWRERRAVRALGSREWLALVAVAVGASAIATVLFTASFSFRNPTATILLQKTQPLFAIALATLVLKERLVPGFWPAAALALVGAYLVSFKDPAQPAGLLSPADGGAALAAALLALGAAALWGGGTVFGRFLLRRLDFPTLAALRFTLALPALAILVLLSGQGLGPGPAAADDWGRFLLLALVPGLLGMLLYYKGLQGTRASIATLAELAFPLSAVVLNWWLLGAALTLSQMVGGALLVGAILRLNLVQARLPALEPPAEGQPLAATS